MRNLDLTRRSTPEGVRRIVHASRHPPTLPCGPSTQALQSGILGSWGGSWSTLGSSWRVLGHLLGASWRVLGSWKPLGGVLEGPCSDFGGHQSYLGDVLDGLEVILEALWELLGSKSEPKGRLMGVQKGPKSTS